MIRTQLGPSGSPFQSVGHATLRNRDSKPKGTAGKRVALSGMVSIGSLIKTRLPRRAAATGACPFREHSVPAFW